VAAEAGRRNYFVDTNEIEQHAAAIRPNTKIIHIESPTNPMAKLVDLEKIAALGKSMG
jgi:cystathionine beta-lyase/cystathionine gamma-synthase